jgi:DNA polymerase epsilon subunit 3
MLQIPDNVKMQQEVIMALMRSSTLFINYLSGSSFSSSTCLTDLQRRRKSAETRCNVNRTLIFSAHDQALARSGKSITASDVMKAITEMDFGPADNLVPLLEVELAGGSSLHSY